MATGSPDADGRDADGASVSDARDASSSLDGGGSEADTLQKVDASSPPDTVMMDTANADGELGDAASAEAGELDPDAGSDADSVGDGAAPDSGPTIDPDLVLWYRFDESNGNIATDSARFDGVARNATLMTAFGGSATFSTTRRVGTNALALSPGMPANNGGGYVVLPRDVLNKLAPRAVTIAVWVRPTGAQVWQRIFDFADSKDAPGWFNLAARGDTSPFGPVFNMSSGGHAASDQQKLTGSTALAANQWHHIAVVLPDEDAPFTGRMYVNGELAATNGAMTVHLSDIGAKNNNWLGRSQFPNDPYFNGLIDDFRVYRRALSPAEIQALMAVH